MVPSAQPSSRKSTGVVSVDYRQQPWEVPVHNILGSLRRPVANDIEVRQGSLQQLIQGCAESASGALQGADENIQPWPISESLDLTDASGLASNPASHLHYQPLPYPISFCFFYCIISSVLLLPLHSRASPHPKANKARPKPCCQCPLHMHGVLASAFTTRPALAEASSLCRPSRDYGNSMRTNCQTS
jgi:hypothetical protein